jgi:hypothetical protein
VRLPMRTDVIVKTWWGDLSFCSYCLRFLEKYWQEPESNILVLANRNCREVCESWRFSPRVRYFYVDPWPDGNQFQCYLTFLADHFSDADLFAVFDSDCILTEPMRASDKLQEGKPIICYEPLSEMVKNPGRVMAVNLWFPIMEYWLGQRPTADFMCRFPMIYWAETIRGVRRLVTQKTGLGLLEALYSGVPYDPKVHFVEHPFKMCEHNVLGFYAHVHEPQRYHFMPMTERFWPVRQYHSWTQWSAERQNELEAMLK